MTTIARAIASLLVNNIPFLGLSPLTRGNHTARIKLCLISGSIPAHAGKPEELDNFNTLARVYPRSRGETFDKEPPHRLLRGLSPLTRGNRGGLIARPFYGGSIPAHAGKPTCAMSMEAQRWVYPRSRGETLDRRLFREDCWGLSPLTRGNRNQSLILVLVVGSIPAHAGKPHRGNRTSRRRKVYPRSRGETVVGSRSAAPDGGLSPLTRGNHMQRLRIAPIFGSIPAHAGKPLAAALAVKVEGVYPRSRGETVCACSF